MIQFRWITTIVGELEDMFRDDPNVFVAGDLLWYPVEGETKIKSIEPPILWSFLVVPKRIVNVIF
ncbi:hypothetical protein PN36_05835 [Candidatus Thiomargarita nelsonii]|uniref:Uncharacterized protein n=1 Tax=Candidatus Thiomargarita nelsonii TaxID=1003181 RepID=A0A0A6P2A6_9GAMM|nr:hypothetical protein PN36_05835 [Candidatus Thiomargarita nelsonii]